MTTAANSDPYEERSSLPEELEAVRITSIEERRGTVLFMKLAGATFTTIAEHCKVSVATVRKDFDKALAAQAGHWTPERRIARQSAVLTDALRANYPVMMNGDASEKKDATVAILRVLEREAKLFGLDAPQRIIADVNPADFANEAARLISKITRLDPNELKELTRVGYQPPPREQPIDVEEVRTGDDFPEYPGPTWPDAEMDAEAAEHPAARGSAAPGTGREGHAVSGQPDSASVPSRPEARAVNRGVSDEPVAAEAADDLDGWSNI